MTDTTYDPEADAAYVRIGRGKVAETREVTPGVLLDYDAKGRLLGVELLTASRALAPGDWSRAPRPGERGAHSDAAE